MTNTICSSELITFSVLQDFPCGSPNLLLSYAVVIHTSETLITFLYVAERNAALINFNCIPRNEILWSKNFNTFLPKFISITAKSLDWTWAMHAFWKCGNWSIAWEKTMFRFIFAEIRIGRRRYMHSVLTKKRYAFLHTQDPDTDPRLSQIWIRQGQNSRMRIRSSAW